MQKPKNKTLVFDSLTIPTSASEPVPIGSLLTTLTAKQKAAVRGVEIRAHGASFYFGTYTGAAWVYKDTQAANLPYYRECGMEHLDKTSVGAVAAANITNVVIEVELAYYGA